MSLNIELLEQSFDLVKGRGNEFTAQFYANLFSDYPTAKPLFDNTHMEEQGKKLLASLVLVVDALRKPELLETALKGLGTRHVQYGVLPEHYPMVGGSLLKTFETVLGADWTPDVKQAWTDAYGGVTQLMLEGADYPSEVLKLTS
jgi:hemoglobin-like flavoprotein